MPAPQRSEAAALEAVPEPTVDTVLVTGLPAVIEIGRRILAAEPPLCLDFSLRAHELPVPALQVTTVGMSDARLVSLATDAPGECAVDDRAQSILSIANLDARGHPVRLILPADAFPRSEGGATGRLIVLRPGRIPAETPLVLRRQDWPPAAKGSFWFIGIALPAAIAAGLGVLVYAAQKGVEARAAEKAGFTRFQRDESGDLKKFFSGLYQNIVRMSSDAEFAEAMERELASRRILFELPPTARERVYTALRASDRKAVTSELAKAFPMYADILRQQSGR